MYTRRVVRTMTVTVAGVCDENLIYVDRQIDYDRLLVSEFQLASIRIAGEDAHIDTMLVELSARARLQKLNAAVANPDIAAFTISAFR